MLGLTVNSKLGGTRSSVVEYVTLSMSAESWNEGGGERGGEVSGGHSEKVFVEAMMKTKRSSCIASSLGLSDTDLIPSKRHGNWVGEWSVVAFRMDGEKERGRERKCERERERKRREC